MAMTEGFRGFMPLEVSSNFSKEKERQYPIEVVIWDLDGTLLENQDKKKEDFLGITTRTFSVTEDQALIHYNRNPDLPSRDQVFSFARKLGISIREKNVREAAEDLFDLYSKAGGDPLPYTVNTTRSFRSVGIRNAINTGSRERDGRQKLRGTGLRKSISTVVGVDSGSAGIPLRKGEPQFRVTARRLGYPEYEKFTKVIMMVTDTFGDVREIVPTGVPIYAVSKSKETRREMLDEGASIAAEDLSGLRSYVERINTRAAKLNGINP